MILPTKHLTEEKALLRVGAEILALLEEPKTVSRTWNEFQKRRMMMKSTKSITYSWFVLALDLLYILGAVNYTRGHLSKAKQ
jgi:hypothetical protein